MLTEVKLDIDSWSLLKVEWKNNLDNELDYGNIEGLKEALDNPFSMAYSNRQGTDLSELYHVSTGDVVFSIPKGRHTGCKFPSYSDDNYLMLHLLSKMKQRK